MRVNVIGLAVIAVVGVPLFILGYILIAEIFVSKIRGDKKRKKIRPWLWVAPAFFLLIVFLIYPVINTIVLSLRNADSTKFVGLKNYIFIFTDKVMLSAIKNNILWLVFVTLCTVTIGLLIAVLTDRIRYESVAKAFIFMPMAISAVAAGVIWKFMYEFRPKGMPQIGTVNAFLTAVSPSFQPKAWLFNPPINTFALMVVYIWIWTGFCMVILSAGLKGIPDSLLEAARMDGANEWTIFWRIIIPTMSSTIIVVTTTMVINVLKVFDVVYVMTNGTLGTEVIANRMYKEMFNFHNFGRASAIAVLLLVAIIPVMLVNIKRFGQGRG